MRMQPTLRELSELSDPDLDPRIRAALEFVYLFNVWLESDAMVEVDPRDSRHWDEMIDAFEAWERLR